MSELMKNVDVSMLNQKFENTTKLPTAIERYVAELLYGSEEIAQKLFLQNKVLDKKNIQGNTGNYYCDSCVKIGKSGITEIISFQSRCADEGRTIKIICTTCGKYL